MFQEKSYKLKIYLSPTHNKHSIREYSEHGKKQTTDDSRANLEKKLTSGRSICYRREHEKPINQKQKHVTKRRLSTRHEPHKSVHKLPLSLQPRPPS
ncbi:hypothetical protein YC2023_024289 [Brassica napus]